MNKQFSVCERTVQTVSRKFTVHPVAAPRNKDSKHKMALLQQKAVCVCCGTVSWNPRLNCKHQYIKFWLEQFKVTSDVLRKKGAGRAFIDVDIVNGVREAF